MDLIKLSSTSTQFPVDSRDLHAAMEVASYHTTWILRRVEDFIDGEDYLSRMEGSEKVFMLSLDVAKHCSMLERTEKGKMARQWFIEREKLVSKPMSMSERLLHQAQLAFDQEKRLDEQAKRLDVVEKAISYENIHQMVQDSLEEETINVFPANCSKLETIRETVFVGMSTSIISQFLNHIKHPTKEYTFKMSDNVLRSITVFHNHGLVDAFNRFKSESIFQKNTPLNLQYTHPVIGNYRIKKS